MKITIEQITPQMAEQMLRKNVGNFRNLSTSRVESYAQAMRAGKWEGLNGATIVFDTNGELLDGQHRLHAIIASGVTIQTAVVREAETDGLSIDRGKPRTIGQWLAHSNVKNSRTMAAGVKLILLHDAGLWSQQSVGGFSPIDAELVAYTKQRESELQEALQLARLTKKLFPESIGIAIAHIGSRPFSVSPRAHRFFERLSSGANLKPGDPALALRNQLLARTGTKKIPVITKRILLTIAWNKNARGESCQLIRFAKNKSGRPNIPNKILAEWDV